jgi:cell division protein FtsN
VAARARRGQSSRTGTMFVLVGLLAILGATFGAGVVTGRHRARPAPASERPATEKNDGRVGDRPGVPAPPTLTFYQELTAPLAAPPPPPPPKPARPPKPVDAAVIPSRPTAEPAAATPGAPGPRYTVQVGAYRVKPPADALRATLVAAGHDAHVVESDAPGGARYRVRVGVFATREAAREAAARLGAERTLATFVTAVESAR